jgi:6-pyruvoyl-tetrahydropterin synthase related domain
VLRSGIVLDSAAGAPAARRDLGVLLAASLLSAGILFLPLLAGGGVPRSYDLPDHLGTTVQVLRGFREGLAYPRWLPDFNDGWGEPTLVFYPPLFYFLAAGLAALLGGDPVGGLFAAVLLFAVVGAAGVFVLVRRTFGVVTGAFAALLFAGIPYRFFEIYAGGLYPAFAAACLLPWALASLVEIAGGTARGGATKAVLAWPILFALVVLTNLPTAVMLAYLVAAWLAIRVVADRSVAGAGRVVGGGIWGALLAAVFLLPALAELGAVHVTFEEGTLYRSNFLFQPSGSWMRPGLKSTFDRMGLFPALAFLLALRLWEAARRRQRPDSALAAPRLRGWMLTLFSVGAVSLLLVTPLSAPAWRFLPYLKRINIPWRFLEPLGLAASCLTAAAAWALARERRVPRSIALLSLVFFLLLAGVCGAFDASLAFVNGRIPARACREALPGFAGKPGTYTPVRARPAAELPPVPAVACDPPCRVEILAWGSQRRELRVSSPEDARLLVRTYDFPGWSAESGGRLLAVAEDERTGAMVIPVPKGERRVTLRFRSTPDRSAGAIVSAAALVAWIAVAGRALRAR